MNTLNKASLSRRGWWMGSESALHTSEWGRSLLMAALLLLSLNLQAQDTDSQRSDWSINTRAWSTNYFTTLIVGGIEAIGKTFIHDDRDSVLIDRIIPSPALVFPVGLQRRGFSYPMDIYQPYHRAFANPFAHIGDYAIGLDAAWTPSVVGCYAGFYFKSQEVCFTGPDYPSVRSFMLQPRVGLSVNFGSERKTGIEAGVFYDAVTGIGGDGQDRDKDVLKNGWGLDFALRHNSDKGKRQSVIQFSMPLHNFFANGTGWKRRVGYIMFTHRLML